MGNSVFFFVIIRSKLQIGGAADFNCKIRADITNTVDLRKLDILIQTRVNLKKVSPTFLLSLPKCNLFDSSPVLPLNAPSWLVCVSFEFLYSFKPYDQLVGTEIV